MNVKKLLALILISSVIYTSLKPAAMPELPLTPPMQKALTDITDATRTKTADEVMALIEKVGKQEGFNLAILLTRPDRSGKTLFEYLAEMKDFEKIASRLGNLGLEIHDFSLYAKSELNKALKNAQNEIKKEIGKDEIYLRSNINTKLRDMVSTSNKLSDSINNLTKFISDDFYSKQTDVKRVKDNYAAAITLRDVLDKVNELTAEAFD